MPIIIIDHFIMRFIWTILMLLGFLLIVLAGHFYVSLFIIVINVGMYNEIMLQKTNQEKSVQLKFQSFLSLYFLGISLFFFDAKLIAIKLGNQLQETLYI